MLILVNKSTGEIRAAPAADTIGPQAADEAEILIDSSHQIYKPETGDVVEVPPWSPQVPPDLPARISALESRVAALEATNAALEARVANLEVEIIEVAGYATSPPPAQQSGGD